MTTQPSWLLGKLLAFIRAHGHACGVNADGSLWVESRGTTAQGAPFTVRATMPADYRAVRRHLGY